MVTIPRFAGQAGRAPLAVRSSHSFLVLFAGLLCLFSAGCGTGTSTSSAPVNPAKTLASIAVSPSPISLAPGSTQQLTATATYSDSTTANVSSQVAWASSNTALATVSASGMATGVAAGSASLNATLSGISGSAQVTVVQPARTLTTIVITPASSSVAVGTTQQLTATATYSDNSNANITSQVSWASSNSAFATVSSTGMVTGVAAGSATVSAALAGVSATAQVTVPQPPKTLASITISPANPTVAIGSTQQLTATAAYSDNSTANVTAQVSWTSAKAAVATVSASGLVTSVAAGSAAVTATLTGVSGTTQITVPQAPRTLTSIAVSPATPSVVAGATQQFTATATYSDNSTANVTAQVSWTSSATAVATVSASGLATGVAAGSTTISASLNGVSGATVLAVKAKTLVSIAITPNPVSVALGSTQQLTATATYQDGSTQNITSTVAWAPANQAVITVNSSGLATPDAAGSTTITASLNGVSGNTPVTVSIAPNTGVNLTTWQADEQRSGLNAGEKSLTPSNVSAATFGKLFSYQMDGYEYGEPLLLSDVTINNVKHNVLFAATEHDSVYAFDADSYGTGAPLWQTSLLQGNETPLTNGPIKPYQGVTSTPVIDATTNTIYVVSTQIAPSGGGTFRLNALDITTGAQKPGSPILIQAAVPGSNSDAVNGVVSLTTSCVQRAALLLNNGTLYIGFGGCHSGWLLAYNAQSLAQTGVFNSSPDLNGEGPYASAGGIWMGGGGPVADSAGNVYVSTGNGPWDGTKAWGDSVLKFNAQLQVVDSFTPDDYAYMNCQDADLAAGGIMMIPGTTQLLAGGKIGKLYEVNSTNLGGEQANDAGATQTLFVQTGMLNPYTNSCTDASGTHTTMINSYEIFGTAAYYNQSVYIGVTPTGTNVPSGVRQFTYAAGNLTPFAETTANIQQKSYGTTPFISSNGTGNGILWMIDHGTPLQSGTSTAAILRAYDANDLTHELYNSSTNPGDTPGYGIKFTSAVAANGKVYLPTGHDLTTTANPMGELDVYGLK